MMWKWKWWWGIGVVLAATPAAAVFPSTQYTYSEPAGVIVKSQFSALAEEVEALEDVLHFTCGTNLNCVLDTSDINTSSKIAAIVNDETGTSKLVFNTEPSLVRPIIEGTTGDSTPIRTELPAAGVAGRVAIITDGNPDCSTGGGSSLVLCRDNGTTWTTVGGSGGASGGVSASEPYCQTIQGLGAADDNIMLVAFPVAVETQKLSCHCGGTCSTVATILFERDDNGNDVGSAVTCSVNTADMTWTDVSGDADGALAVGERLKWSVNNTPLPDGDDQYLICATFAG